MKNKCFVDTSAFVALNNPNDQHHHEAIEIANKLGHYDFHLSEAVLTEAYTLLRYRLGFHVARRFLASIIEQRQFQVVDISTDIRREALSLLEKYNDHKISYCDALTVAIMTRNQVDKVFTFDHHFELMGVNRFY